MKGYLRKRGRVWYTTIELRRPDGERKQKCIRIGEMSKAEAQGREREILRAFDSGEWTDDRSLTVADLLKTWLEDNEHQISATTWEYYETNIRLHLIPALGTVPLSKLTPRHIVDAYAQIRSRGLSGQTCLHVHRVLSAALNYAKKTLRVVKENVAESVPSPKVERKELPPLSAQQVRTIIEMVRGTRLEIPVLVAALTGLRRGELLALKWRGVDFERGRIVVTEALEQTRRHGIRFKAPKSRSSRRVLPAADELLEILREHKARQGEQRARFGASYVDQDLVFCEESGVPWPPDTFSRQFSVMTRNAGLAGFRFHDSRHAFASLALTNGTSIKEVSALLGHASATLTLSTYAHVIAGMGREAVSGVAKSVLSGFGGSVSKCEQIAAEGEMG